METAETKDVQLVMNDNYGKIGIDQMDNIDKLYEFLTYSKLLIQNASSADNDLSVFKCIFLIILFLA